MAPSSSKQKRMAEKAMKQSAKQKGAPAPSETEGTSTLVDSASGSGATTPNAFACKNVSSEELTMAKLAIATDR